jgi:hypothetical protein
LFAGKNQVVEYSELNNGKLLMPKIKSSSTVISTRQMQNNVNIVQVNAAELQKFCDDDIWASSVSDVRCCQNVKHLTFSNIFLVSTFCP